MAFPKLVGFSFGVADEMFPPVKKQNGFENEYMSRNSILGLCGFLELTLGSNGRRKEDVGVGGFSQLHELFPGSLENGNVKEGLGGNGMPEIYNLSKKVVHDGGSDGMHKKKGAFTKCMSPSGDPSNGISDSVSKRMKRNHFKNREPLESDFQNMATTDSSSILLSCGWMVVAREGRDASYVSPSGSVYGSLPKALEAFSRDASKFAERQCCLFQSVASSGDNVAQVTTKIKKKSTRSRTRTVVQPISEAALHQQQEHQPKQQQQHRQQQQQSFGEECDEEPSRLLVRTKWNRSIKNREKSSVQDKCLTGVIIELGSSEVEVGQVTVNSAICTTDIQQGDIIPGARETVVPETVHNMEMRGEEENTSKPVEQISMPEGVHELVVMNKKLSGEKHAKDCLGLIETTNDYNGSADMYRNRKEQGERRSARIKGKHVPVDDELSMGVWFDGAYFDSSDPVDMLLLDRCLSQQESYKKRTVKGPLVPQKMKYREVSELLATSMGEEKVGKVYGDGASAYPEEMAFGEVHRGLASCMADEKGKSCVEDDCLSNETKWFEGTNDVVTNDQGGNNKVQLDYDFVRTRRSNCIKGRHVPVDCEANMGMSACGEFSRFSRVLGDSAKTMMTEKHLTRRIKSKPVSSRCSNEKEKTKRSGGCSLIARPGNSYPGDTILSETKLTIVSWLIDSGVLAENTKVVYKIDEDQKIRLTGGITRGGIRCDCCRMVLSLSEFEVHAGSNLRQPWKNICLISGKSLMECHSEAWEKEKRQRTIGFRVVGIGDADPSDDTCGICADGGNLLCCDGCPSTFHQECVMLKFLPEGSWYCPYCSCRFCSRGDLCHDKPLGTTTSLISCNQCGCKYHINCVTKNDVHKMGTGSQAYCGKNCKEVASGLSDFLGVSNPIPGGFSWVLVKRLDEVEGTDSKQIQSSVMECNARLPLALLALHECFVPLIDPRSGLDMITQAVNNCGSNYKRLNYEGFYTVILEKDDEIISVATIRLHGSRVAEMPFIGTRPLYRHQGMCRRLLDAIEEILSKLHVENLIIPSTPAMLETWTKSFSFQHFELSCDDEFRNLNIVQFADTTILQKPIHYGKAVTVRDVNQVGDTEGYAQDVLNCSCEEMRASTSTYNMSFPILPKASRGSDFDVCPVQSPLYQNINEISPISLKVDPIH